MTNAQTERALKVDRDLLIRERDAYKAALEKIRESDGGYAPAIARIALEQWRSR